MAQRKIGPFFWFWTKKQRLNVISGMSQLLAKKTIFFEFYFGKFYSIILDYRITESIMIINQRLIIKGVNI